MLACSRGSQHVQQIAHLQVAMPLQVHQHAEGRLPGDADRVHVAQAIVMHGRQPSLGPQVLPGQDGEPLEGRGV